MCKLKLPTRFWNIQIFDKDKILLHKWQYYGWVKLKMISRVIHIYDRRIQTNFFYINNVLEDCSASYTVRIEVLDDYKRTCTKDGYVAKLATTKVEIRELVDFER